ncbi:sensor histidine kinase [Pseudonocardia sp. C8]|uniref:sensor histidine kinase n=1 Tax=Pseudonocardia sp. C8 TaxID=2762759 RepID=UPI001643288E|nr:sensor histidine kinase [Pseudonocardia sp. C8]MBC3193869.1 sensor histidine kinase [Pseudonocardia sp. C8]
MTAGTTAGAPGTTPRGPADVPAGVPARARPAVLPVALLGVPSLAALAAAVAIELRVPDGAVPGEAGLEPAWATVAIATVLLGTGVLLVARLPRHPVAWVLAGSGALWALDAAAAAWTRYGLHVAADPGLPLLSPAWWFWNRLGATLLLGLPLLLLLFPDGRLPAGRVWRPLSVASLLSTALLPLTLVLVPAAEVQAYSGVAPRPEELALDRDLLSVPLPFWQPVLALAYLMVPLSLVVPAAAVVSRYRAAVGERRLQLRWLVWAGLVSAVAVAPMWVVPAPGPSVLLAVAVAATSGAVVVAVTRHRLYDVDRLLSGTVVSVLLVALVGAVDVLVLALAGNLLGGRDATFLAVAVVAVLYTPLRTRLWATARRVVRGRRDDPYGALSTLAERLERAAGDRQLAAVATSVAEAFRLPYVRVVTSRPDGGTAVAEHGRPNGPVSSLPVTWRDEPIGRVELCVGGTALSDTDQRLLGDLVRQAATAARADELTTRLQQHRTALVTAREEERRRLRRDLHDGLGPALGAVALRIETARNLAAGDPAGADRMLEAAIGDVAAVLADMRRLVHELRPPALDDLGPAGALRELARRTAPAGLEVTVTEDGDGPPLPAAVEVAAYRIAAEALVNVVRHAGARTARVSLVREPGTLVVEVADDGRGIAPDVAAGVGTLSVRERAAELGGTCAVLAADGGGTVVRARLPLGKG